MTLVIKTFVCLVQTDVDMEHTNLSCDEVLSMSRSMNDAEMSDASSQLSSNHRHLQQEDEPPCPRCLLDSMSNRAILSEDCKHGHDENRWEWISSLPLLKNGPTRPLSCLFSVFSNKQYNIYNKSMQKMSCPSRILRWNLNPWPLKHESSPIT